MKRPRHRLSPGNGPRPESLEPADDCEGSLMGPDEEDEDERQRADELRGDAIRDES